MDVQEALEKKGLAGGKFKLSENFIFCFAKVRYLPAATHYYPLLPTTTYYYPLLLATTHDYSLHSLLSTTDHLLPVLTTDYVYLCSAKVRELLSEGRPARDFEWTNVQVGGHGAGWG